VSLPWGLIDNRPFLRYMQGYGLCLWRLQQFEDGVWLLEFTIPPSDENLPMQVRAACQARLPPQKMPALDSLAALLR
jgi:hypothetical protein